MIKQNICFDLYVRWPITVWYERSVIRRSPPQRGMLSTTFGQKVCSVTKSSDEGQYLDHIWLKSATRRSPPMRGNIWTTFGRSPLRDEVLQQGAIFGPHLVKVCCVIKSSDEGQIFGPHLVGIAVRYICLPHLEIVRCVTIFFDHIWSLRHFVDNEYLC